MAAKQLKRIRGVTDETTEAARDLRRRQTPAEAILWQELRARRLAGLKFRRQQPLGPYIADFCCAERRLILELDGAIHDEQKEYDSARTEHLEAYGYTVIRFHNDDVLTNLSGVLARIASQALRLPSPRIGRGAGGEGPSEDTTLAW